MRSRRRQACLIVVNTACLLTAILSPAATMAGGKGGSNGFTIKAQDDTYAEGWGGAGHEPSFSGTGAIRDKGTWWNSDSLVDENGDYWYLYTFLGSAGEFHIGWLPTDWLEEGVEYPVEVYPGTGAYADVSGTAVVTATMSKHYYWIYEPYMVYRYRSYYYEVTWTIKGTLDP